MHQIVSENLHDPSFISRRCEEFEPFLQSLNRYDIKTVEALTGVAGEKIRQSAQLFGKAKKAIVLYGMGITQHTTGTDNVKTIANLLMLTGNLGRRGTGFSPLRGQNNVQGACDMGALPVVYPGYQRVDNPAVREKFEKAWGRNLSEKPGLTITEMVQAAHEGRLKALYVEELRPQLEAALWMHGRKRLVEPRPEFLAASRQRLVAQIQGAGLAGASAAPAVVRRPAARTWQPNTRWTLSFALILMSLFSIFLIGEMLTYASQDSLPGEMLYPVKLASEKARLALSLKPSGDAELYIEYAQRRLSEIAINPGRTL